MALRKYRPGDTCRHGFTVPGRENRLRLTCRECFAETRCRCPKGERKAIQGTTECHSCGKEIRYYPTPRISANDVYLETGQIVVYGYATGMARCRVRGITMRGNVQLLDLDTPGRELTCRSPELLWVLSDGAEWKVRGIGGSVGGNRTLVGLEFETDTLYGSVNEARATLEERLS